MGCCESEGPDGCMNKASNEITVPAPLKSQCVRDWMEHSGVMRGYGKCGIPCAEANRTPIMCSAFIASLVSWIFMILAALAVSESSAPIQKFAWVKATADAPGLKVNMDLGIKALAVTTYNKTSMVEEERVAAWSDDVCGHSVSAEMETACDKCEEQLSSTTSFIFLSIVTQIPQLTTDLQRTTAFGDVNCQKTFGTITGIFGALSGMATMVSFANACWNDLPTTLVLNNTYTDYQAIPVPITWEGGTGWTLMLIAVMLKIFDVFCHFIVPTPPGRHEPYQGTLLNYMKTGVDGCKGEQVEMTASKDHSVV